MKPNRLFKGHRTRIVNAAIGAVGIAGVFGEILNIPELKQIVPQQYWPHFVLGMAVVNIILRQITTTPPGRKY